LTWRAVKKKNHHRAFLPANLEFGGASFFILIWSEVRVRKKNMIIQFI